MIKKGFLYLILQTKKLSCVAPHLVKLTGKSKEPIHPKHLISDNSAWFSDYSKKKDIILDIGCGNGQNALKAAKKCQRVVGIEINEKQLQIAKREKERRKVKNVDFKKANLEKKLDLKKESFSAVLFLDVLEHLYKRRQILKEIHRVLKKNGRLFLSIPNKNTSWKKTLKKAGLPYYSDPDHKIEYIQKEIEKELNKTGFKIAKVMPVIYDFPFVGFIDIIGGFSLSLYQKIIQWRVNKVHKFPEETTGFRIICKK